LHRASGASSIALGSPHGGLGLLRGWGRRSRMADQAYCMKCREKREFEGQLVTLKTGRPAMQGTCPVCGTKLTKIMGMDAAKAMGWSAP
jgi:hypothetical protein